MHFENMLITGGAGFVGANLAVAFKRRYPGLRVTALDNLKRRGSELNLSRLSAAGIGFMHGDIRNPEDLAAAGAVDVIVECSAEPSVLAGFDGNPAYLLNTNLLGTVNCLELARARKAAFVFLSTSRVYPHTAINRLRRQEEESRFQWAPDQQCPGWSPAGITQQFTLDGEKTLYGASKLCSEILIREYVGMFGLKAVVNRCGLLTGPWQFGKVDQGVITYWMLAHYFKRNLAYIGFGGGGKQVRDPLHVEDLAGLVGRQLSRPESLDGSVYDVGGGPGNSLSLLECTRRCAEITGNRIPIANDTQTRPGDIAIFISDSGAAARDFNWKPTRTVDAILEDIYAWVRANEARVQAF